MASIIKRGDKYQAQVRLSGQKPQYKTFSSYTLALAYARKAEGSEGTLQLDYPIPTLAEIIDSYLDQYNRKDPAVHGRLKFWKEQLGDYPINDIDPFMVNKGLAVLAIDKTNSTVNRYKTNLSAQFLYFIAGHHIQADTQEERKLAVEAHQDLLIQLKATKFSNPVTDEMTVKYSENKSKEVFLTIEQQKALLKSCKENHWDRLYLLVLMALTTGARKGELLGLKWADIDFNERTAYLPLTKNGKSRYLPLTASVIEELMKFREVGGSLIFHSTISKDVPFDIKKAWLKALDKSGIGQIRFHDLRHTCASNLVRAGRSLFEVGTLLGHSSPQMTARYSHLAVKDTQDMVDIVMGGLS